MSFAELVDGLIDLVLPATCAGCDEPSARALCVPCRAALEAAIPQRTRPDPEPAGLPPTFALAAYAGSVRRAVVQYKEENRHELTSALGGLLARVVLRSLPASGGGAMLGLARGPMPDSGRGPMLGSGRRPMLGPGLGPMAGPNAGPARGPMLGRTARTAHGPVVSPARGWTVGPDVRPVAGPVVDLAVRPVVLVPVPATAAAARRRHGDHMLRLAKAAVRSLPGASIARPLRALPKAEDSAELSAAQRALAARRAFAIRRAHAADLRTRLARTGATVVLVDDIVTTGVTLAAAAGRLAEAGIRVDRTAVLAATQRRDVSTSPRRPGTAPQRRGKTM
ncbi:phosphoribosyltransferase family protein [Dactylosporangium sp. NPDC051484]|uniref:ComF family protein n=1 Tax=Dactylosporangium sp. NPDC051484 TaxID=3154942 RepID=UPI003450D25B